MYFRNGSLRGSLVTNTRNGTAVLTTLWRYLVCIVVTRAFHFNRFEYLIGNNIRTNIGWICKLRATKWLEIWETMGYKPHQITILLRRPSPASIRNYTHYKMWDEISYPFPNFNGSTVDVWEWITDFIPHFIMDVLTYGCQRQFNSTRYWIYDYLSMLALNCITQDRWNLIASPFPKQFAVIDARPINWLTSS